LVHQASAQEAVRLREIFSPDYQYRVSTRVQLTGRLSLPPEKGKPVGPLVIKGSSAIDYDERILVSRNDGEVDKTVRIYRRMDFERRVGEQLQKNALREDVRRLVVMRMRNVEVPFCPEGPLSRSEIDLVRTDVFTPALVSLLPSQPVREGERWVARAGAVQELTDLERIEEGQVECQLEGVVSVEKRRHARVTFSGTVRGTNEDGPNRQTLDGYFFFDLESNHLSYLFLKGIHYLLDRDGKESGRVEGQFVLTRQAHTLARELSDEALKGLTLQPNVENTQLVYDNPDLGLRFLYPRRWRVAGDLGRQVRLDGSDGSGLLITLEPPARVPTAAQFLAESRGWFLSQKARVVRADPPQRVQFGTREMDHFALEVETAKERLFMDYYLVRQAAGGATLAARIPLAEPTAMQREVERIARSVTISQPRRQAPAGK
jgi:hypothetical protein